MCKALDLSPRTWHGRLSRELAAPTQAQIDFNRLSLLVRGVFKDHKGKFGARRLAHYLLAHKGVKVSRRCVMAILAASNLTCQIRRKKKPVSSNSVKARAYDNQLARYRKTAKPNEAWRTDITYIHTKNGFGYLAAVMDDYTRKIIGWAWSSRCDTDLALDALKMACVQRKAGAGIIVHSDRGAQYTSRAWQDMLAQRGMIGSMSAKGNCYDNASMERFFGTLKDEKVRGESPRSLQEVKEAIANWIAMEYNTKRPHSSLGYISPCAFEEKLSRMNLVD